MRILYSAAGEGMGHAVRSRVVIEELKKKHDVLVIGARKSFKYLSRYFGAKRLLYFKLLYSNNKLANIPTILFNALLLPFILLYNLRIIYYLAKFKPELVISDFEFFSSYSASLFGIPCISIDNMHILTNANVGYDKKLENESLLTKLALKMFKADYFLVSTFFYPKAKDKRTFLVPPILRKEILRLKPKAGKHILVYQTSKSYNELIPILKQTDVVCVIYGLNGNKSGGNLIFKKFNENEFFDDLANCKAVITNGGFTLITEALHLGKPVLSVPIRSQFEQIINAIYLQRLGYGESHRYLTKEKIEAFLSRLSVYRNNLKKYKKEDNSQVFSRLDEIIGKVKKIK